MSQYESTQPREFSAFWSAPASYGRGTYYNRVTVYCMGRGHHKERSMFDQRLWVLFGYEKVAAE